MDKPTKPSNLMPRTFGGVKNNFSADLQSTGYEDGVPAIYGGDNLNYQLNATGQELNYCETICDYINALPIGKTISVDSNNKLIYADLTTDISNKANIELDNLSTEGEERLHALKSYLEEGEIYTDNAGYSDVYKMRYSTFDLDKFTSVGTPTISSNGIFSDVSNSNYIFADYQISNLLNKSWSVISPVITGITTNDYGDELLALTPAGYGADGVAVFAGTKKRLVFTINTPSDISPETRANNRISILKDLSTLPAKLQARLDFDYTTGKYTGYYNIFDGNGWQKAGEVTPTTSEKQLYDIVYNNSIFVRAYSRENSNANFITGDLKYFKIKVNGATVFDGNKTGTDTVMIGGSLVLIPYVLSKTGAKIAESTYRTQIENLYAQEGIADYYTIDEENKTFTLPMGDLAGLRAQKEDLDNKVNELSESTIEYPSCYAVSQALTGAGGFTPYCANSGNVDVNGDADIIATNSTEDTIPYTQPVLTANGTAGTSELAVRWYKDDGTTTYSELYNDSASYPNEKPYKMFDGNTPEVAHISPSYVNQLRMTFKDAVCLTKIQQLNISSGSYHWFTGLIKASNDGTNWATLLTFTQTYVGADNILTLSFANTNNYIYYELQYDNTNYTYGGSAVIPITELQLTGTITAGTAGSQVFYKIGGTYPNLALTPVKNARFERTGLPVLDVSAMSNGTYNVFVDKTSEEYIANTIYRQNAEPGMPSSGDVWVNIGVEPIVVKKYNGLSWDEYNKIPIGSFTVSSGAVSAVKTFPYNVNGVTDKILENYQNGTSGYHIEWRFDNNTHKFRKYCEQWGYNAYNTTSISYTQDFADGNHKLFLTPEAASAGSVVCSAKTTTGATIVTDLTSGGYSWKAEGYID